MKNFDSVPQLYASVTCITVLQDGVMAQIPQRQSAALLQCGPAGHGFSVLVQQLQDQSPEPLVWTVEGVLSLTLSMTERVALAASAEAVLSGPSFTLDSV